MRHSNRHSLFTTGLWLILLAALWSAGTSADESALRLPIGDPARKDKQVELHLDGITDTSTGDLISPAETAARLADVGILLVGETHTNIDFHRAQHKIIEELHEAGREVLIALEMFPYTQQSVLDGWIAGHYSEDGFVEQSSWYKYWGYHWNYYREIFDYARRNNIRMFGINTPRDVVTAVRKKGFKDLTPEEAAHIPHEVQPATADQRRMYTGFFDADDALHVDDDAIDGMLRAQTTWDATMGWNSLQVLNEHGGDNAIVVILIGSGHVTYGLGAERQTAPYYDGKIASLIPLEMQDEDGAPIKKVQASYANFVWGLPTADDSIYPSLGISLMGSIGKQPTQIIQVSKKSVAERAGIRVGDVLRSLDGEPIEDSVALRESVADYRWGDVAVARLVRKGKTIDITVPFRRVNVDR